MRKTIVKVLILTAICILSFAGCDSQKGVADNSASVNPTTGATSTAENDSTAKPTETKKEPTKQALLYFLVTQCLMLAIIPQCKF